MPFTKTIKIVSVLSVLALSACGGSGGLVKKWQGFDDYQEEMYSLEFFSDKTCIYTYPQGYQSALAERMPCNWKKLKDKRIKVNLTNLGMFADDISSVGFVEIRGDALFVENVGEIENALLYTPERYALERARAERERQQKRQYDQSKSLKTDRDVEVLKNLAKNGHIDSMNALVWAMATEPKHFNGKEAVKLARQAVKLQEKELKQMKTWEAYRTLASYLGGLAVAHARDDDFDMAVKVLKRARGIFEDIKFGQVSDNKYTGERPNITDFTLWQVKDYLYAMEKNAPITRMPLSGVTWKATGQLGGELTVEGAKYSARTGYWMNYSNGRKEIKHSNRSGIVYYFGTNKYLFVPNGRGRASLGLDSSDFEMNGRCNTRIIHVLESSFYDGSQGVDCEFEVNNINYPLPTIYNVLNDETKFEKTKASIQKEAQAGNGKAIELQANYPKFATTSDVISKEQLVTHLKKYKIKGYDYTFAKDAALNGDNRLAKELFIKNEQRTQVLIEGLIAWNKKSNKRSVSTLINEMESNLKITRKERLEPNSGTP